MTHGYTGQVNHGLRATSHRGRALPPRDGLGRRRPWPAIALVALGTMPCPLGSTVQAQDLEPPAALRKHRMFGEDQGLPSAHVLALARDPRGFLWIGTSAGLARFDGRTIQAVRGDLFGGGVEDLASLPSGAMAVVERGRRQLFLVRVEGAALETIELGEGAPAGRAFDVELLEDGSLWLAMADQRLHRRDPAGRWTADPIAQLRHKAVYRLFRSRGALLVSTVTSDESSPELWRAGVGHEAHMLARSPYRGAITSTLEADDGTIWFGTNEGGDGAIYRVTDDRVELALDLPARSTGLLQRGDSLYAAHILGIEVLRPDGAVESVRAPFGPGSGGPLWIDPEGSVWLGTGEGLLQLPEPDTRTWTSAHGLPSSHTTQVTGDRDAIWVSTWDGLGRIERSGGSGRARSIRPDLYPGLRTCSSGGGVLWLPVVESGRLGHVASLAGAQLVRHLELREPSDCDVLADGTVLISAEGLLYLAASSGRQIALLGPLPRGPRWRRFITGNAAGSLWVAWDDRACAADRETLRARGIDAWACEDLPDVGELRDVLLVDARARGLDLVPELWLASMSGGVMRRTASGTWERLLPISEDTPRAAEGMRRSPRGGVWAFGHGFVQRVELVGDSWSIVERVSGWHGMLTHGAGSVHEDDDGALWLASWHGVTRVPPSARDSRPEPPPVEIGSLLVDGEIVRARDLVVAPDHRRIELTMAALAFRDPSQVTYRLRLSSGAENDERDWFVSREPSFRFARLHPGTYRLEAAASLDGERWTTPPARLDFVVRAPWFTRPWSLALFAALALALLWALHRLRTAYLLRLERQRTRIAMDLHDELGAGLGSLGILGGLLGDGVDEPDERRRLGDRIARTAAELGTSLQDILWSLRSADTSVETLAARLADRGRGVFRDRRVRFVTDFPPTWDGPSLDPATVSQIQRIVAEALHNAARHARATCVELGLRPLGQGRGWTLWVADDGVGLEQEDNEEGPGLGLPSMRKRARDIGARLSIDRVATGGTRVELRFDPAGPGRRLWLLRFGSWLSRPARPPR